MLVGLVWHYSLLLTADCRRCKFLNVVNGRGYEHNIVRLVNCMKWQNRFNQAQHGVQHNAFVCLGALLPTVHLCLFRDCTDLSTTYLTP